MEQLNIFWDNLIASGINLGKSIISALIIYLIGRYVVKFINKLFRKMMERRKLDPAVKSFLSSLVNITLTILLLIAVISALGIETTSFAALVASAGVAIGMALSGNLQNFAGGLIILLFKPYKIGDVVETQGKTGSVKEIQIFHTILVTSDNKTIFIPNGSISSGVLTNFSAQDLRRVDWSIGIKYGEDYEKAKSIIDKLLNADKRVLKNPTYMIVIGELATNNVNITIRAWVKSTDYWGVFFDLNNTIYSEFKKQDIGFPFQQIIIHQEKTN